MRQVLITGATGALGSAVVPLFLAEPDTRVVLLLRAADDAALRGRVDELLEFWGSDLADPAARERLTVLRGDVSLPRLGLTEEVWQGLARDLTHIVHAAASVKLDMSEAEATRSSVRPVEEILALAEAGRAAGALRKLDYISTLGVAGRMQGLVPEQPLDGSQGFHSTYESSKAAAERLVLAAMAAGLPATVHRPSMVIGHSATGKIIHFQVFYFLARFLSGAQSWGIVPRLDGLAVDLVPVDYVARAIHWASGAEAATGRILHLCAGPEGAVPAMRLVEIVRACREAQGIALPRLRIVPAAMFKALVAIATLIGSARQRRGMENLQRFLAYAEDRQFFANTATRALLDAARIPLPAAESFIGPALEFEAARRHARAPG
jgi:thioester reductase-like protein